MFNIPTFAAYVQLSFDEAKILSTWKSHVIYLEEINEIQWFLCLPWQPRLRFTLKTWRFPVASLRLKNDPCIIFSEEQGSRCLLKVVLGNSSILILCDLSQKWLHSRQPKFQKSSELPLIVLEELDNDSRIRGKFCPKPLTIKSVFYSHLITTKVLIISGIGKKNFLENI